MKIEMTIGDALLAIQTRLKLLEDMPERNYEAMLHLHRMKQRLEGMVLYKFGYKGLKVMLDDNDLDALTRRPLT